MCLKRNIAFIATVFGFFFPRHFFPPFKFFFYLFMPNQFLLSFEKQLQPTLPVLR